MALAPAGAGSADDMPDRGEYPEGADGEREFAADFRSYVDKNFQGKGVQLRTMHNMVLGLGDILSAHADD